MPYGSVLIVDDVDSNLFVAKGMMLPYGLKIETVTSGFKALEQIRGGKVYDIIFMDHMMPGMDGLEAARKIREMGYTHPIVALTANAVVGKAEMFLENGFNGFISKPIDIRELNAILNRFIRDRQTQNIKASVAAGSPPEMNVSSELAAIVAGDIRKAVIVLEELLPKMDAGDDEDIVLFTTTVHGVKSALANAGEKDLSMVALRLEQAGMKGKISGIASETKEFISTLKLVAEKLSNG
jgi:CheY-like chemotaxis protein